MVTTGAVVEWKDRTDARAQPEKASTVHEEAAPLQLVEEPPTEEIPLAELEAQAPEVDEQDVPPHLRESHA